MQGNVLREAYESCYQSINRLEFAMGLTGLYHDTDSVYQLLNSIREEVITEYLLQQKLFALDYSADESTNSPEQNKTKILLKQAGVSKSSIQQFALGLASAITEIELNLLDDPTTIHTILTEATASCYSPFDSTIAGLLLIAGAVKDSNDAAENSDKNVALRLAQKAIPATITLILSFHWITFHWIK